MKDELDKQLCKKYPKIFRDRNAAMYLTAMCWGFEHGDGWYNIIDNACSVIQHHIDWSRKSRARALRYNRALKRALNGDLKGLEHYHSINGVLSNWGRERIQEDIEKARYDVVPEACTQVVAAQVKEKFGSLRFYVDGGDEFTSGVVHMAEAMSSDTCEVCGAPGEQRQGGWIRTLCDTHAKKKENG